VIIGNKDTREVRIGGETLDPSLSQEYCNHSPDGFAWGYSGSGPAQLALALLLYFTDPDFAVQNYQDFKAEVIAGKDADHTLTLQEMAVVDWATKRGYNW
jgi:hypothetical protein